MPKPTIIPLKAGEKVAVKKMFTLTLGVIALLSLFWAGVPVQSRSEPDQVSETEVNMEFSKEEEEFYVLKEWQGYVAAFAKNHERPFLTLDVLIKNLPVADQEQLKSGIILHSQEELQQKMEDFDG